jgi:hypothetical protein
VAFARVVEFEGGTAEGIRAAAEQVKSDVQSSGGPPEGVRSNGFTFLVDPEGGHVLFLGLFESREDLDASVPVLEAMDAPDGMGQRASVTVYEVGADVRM